MSFRADASAAHRGRARLLAARGRGGALSSRRTRPPPPREPPRRAWRAGPPCATGDVDPSARADARRPDCIATENHRVPRFRRGNALGRGRRAVGGAGRELASARAAACAIVASSSHRARITATQPRRRAPVRSCVRCERIRWLNRGERRPTAGLGDHCVRSSPFHSDGPAQPLPRRRGRGGGAGPCWPVPTRPHPNGHGPRPRLLTPFLATPPQLPPTSTRINAKRKRETSFIKGGRRPPDGM